MRRFLYSFAFAGSLALANYGCSADEGGATFGDDDAEDDTSSTGEGGAGQGGASTFNPTTSANGGSTSSSMNNCVNDQGTDDDADGFTEVDGDCNDCDPNVNPGAIEVMTDDGSGVGGGAPAEPSDEDCNGMIDDVLPTCDDALLLDSADPMDGAKAIDLCQQSTGTSWGVISSAYVRADGQPAGAGMWTGILPNFGPNVNVQNGTSVLALSSGTARRPGDPGACNANTCAATGPGVPPPGFPQDSPNCMQAANINDDIGLEVKVKSPTNATGYSFLFTFYSFEYPEWVCTSYNDQFIALVSPPPMGAVNGNISFDSQNNPVSVNVAFFNVCAGCPLGTNELMGTGFDGAWGDDAGATGWLQTTAPITGGDEVTIRFAIWDTGDSAWDSTVLVDNFQWIANGGTPAVGTQPIPDPK